MTEILQMFTGNPLTTFIGKRIEAATSPDLESDDWALIMEIVDMINQNDDDAKDAVRAIKKRLQQIEQDRNFTVTNRTLTVLEACVKNCSRRFHVLVMSKDFIQDLVKLIGPKNNPPIDLQERVLKLIERWADEFRNQADLGGVVSVYNDLKTKGVTFPPKDPSSMVPIQTPQRSVPPPQQPATAVSLTRSRPNSASLSRNQQQLAGPVVLEGEGYNKISQDLNVVQTSVDMFNDIIKILETKGEESDWKLAADLKSTCGQMKDRIVDLIERVANEDLTIELLRLNDDLNNIFIKYDRLIKNRAKQLGPRLTNTNTNTSSSDNKLIGTRTENELSLIDFNFDDSGAGDRLTTTTTSEGKNTTIAKQDTSTKAATSDPFDTTSVINATTSSQKQNVDPLAHNLNKLNLGTTTSGIDDKVRETPANKKQHTISGLPEEISSVREQDFAEIENWLSTDSGRDLASISADLPSVEPISIPNSEFDNFIASRALAGSTAPTEQQTTNSQQTNRKPEPSI